MVIMTMDALWTFTEKKGVDTTDQNVEWGAGFYYAKFSV
jgi:hypothetical protein